MIHTRRISILISTFQYTEKAICRVICASSNIKQHSYTRKYSCLYQPKNIRILILLLFCTAQLSEKLVSPPKTGQGKIPSNCNDYPNIKLHSLQLSYLISLYRCMNAAHYFQLKYQKLQNDTHSEVIISRYHQVFI